MCANKANKKFYDKVAGAYARRNFSRSRVELLEKVVKGLPKGNKKVLDAGCGPGRDLMWLLAHEVEEAYGVDISKEMVKIAKKYVPKAEIEQMDMVKMKYKDGMFGGLVCLVTLTDIPKNETPKALREFYRVLSKNGMVLITVKQGDRQYFERTAKYGVEYMQFPRHVSLFLAHDLKRFVAEAGFSVVEDTTYTDDSNTWVAVLAKKV